MVDKADGDPSLVGRTIHDITYPESRSINDLTDQSSIPATEYVHCDAIAKVILQVTHNHPGAEVKVVAGDVAAAFRNVSIHNDSVRWFGGLIEEEHILILELCCPFGWTGSPGYYKIVGGAIAYAHGVHINAAYPSGFFNYHWVDDHVNVTADIGSNCDDLERSLRFAMTVVLGAEAVNEDKFTSWSSTQKALGMQFDCIQLSVSMPADKSEKARHLVSAAFHTHRLSRRSYRSLLGSLHHVEACVRPARPFLQCLRQREFQLHRYGYESRFEIVRLFNMKFREVSLVEVMEQPFMIGHLYSSTFHSGPIGHDILPYPANAF